MAGGIGLIGVAALRQRPDLVRAEADLNQIVQDPTIDGVIMTTPQSGAYDDLVKKLMEKNIPIATTNSFDPAIFNRSGISHTGQESSAAAIGGEALAKCLIAKGAKGSVVFPNTTTLGNEEVNRRITAAFNASYQPAISVPMHWTPDGLPVGVQLVVLQLVHGLYGHGFAGQAQRGTPLTTTQVG